jgi:hypothetical protein
VKESEAQWYSINPLYHDILSLADPLKAPADNLLSLLVIFGLGKLGQDNKCFSFQQGASNFKTFGLTFTIHTK